MKRKRLLIVVALTVFCMAFLSFAGCGNNSVDELPDLINLSSSDISIIGLSKYDGMQVKIEDPQKIEKILDLLSMIKIDNSYTEEPVNTEVNGGGGDYRFQIIYSNDTRAHIQIYTEKNVVKISGKTKKGKIDDGYRVYPLTDFAQHQEQVKSLFEELYIVS